MEKFNNNGLDTTDLQREQYLSNSQASIAFVAEEGSEAGDKGAWTLVDHKKGDTKVLVAKDLPAALYEACNEIADRREGDE